jgi:hypothetical protein
MNPKLGFLLILLFCCSVILSAQSKFPTIAVLKILAFGNSDTSKGSGFVVKKGNVYYLVTAKHVFCPSAVQKDYTMPTYQNSCRQISIINAYDSVIAELQLTDERKKALIYRTFNINETQALDVAVLKLKKPAKELKKYSMPFSVLASTDEINYSDTLKTEGYPTRTRKLYSIVSSFATKEYQESLEKDAKYFFIINTEVDLKGMSGGPIFKLSKNSIDKLVGVFVGQNRIAPTYGYGVYSPYIISIINQSDSLKDNR